MEKKAVQTNDAPVVVGPYSQAVKSGGFVFTSGQIPVTAAGEVLKEDIKKQAEQAIKNLAAVLSAYGLSLLDVVKTTVYLKNMADFSSVNDVYSQYFRIPYPARSCVEVSRLPKDALIEIEAVAAAK